MSEQNKEKSQCCGKEPIECTNLDNSHFLLNCRYNCSQCGHSFVPKKHEN